MRWKEHAATVSIEDHRRLVLDLTTGLHEARCAAEVVTTNGELAVLRAHLDVALTALTGARCRLARI